MLKKGEKEYYYLYNSQNDVIGLIDSDGKQVVNYSYDAWGKQTGLTDTSGENIGKLNPFRYRAYCYDDDTKLYVTASRYYDPELCRFLCADNFDVVKAEMFSMNGKNLYVYCCNNPVNAVDDDGDFGILMLALSGIDPQKVAWDIVKGVFVYAVQCGMANEKVTLEGLAEVAIESAIGSVLGGGRGILFSIAINGVKGIYAEYQESGNGARALGAFTDFFSLRYWDMEKAVFWMECLENPRNRKIKRDQHLRKTAIPTLVLKKWREKEKLAE